MSVKGIFVVMTFSVMAWKSLGLKWTTEALHTNCCEGEDKILMWNCSLEKNETVQDYRWFFQSTQIAYVSESGKFVVRDSYKGRLEQIGKMGILLKNVSSVDTGNYSLYLNLGPEPPANMQTIFLTVFESPTYQCKPSIAKYSENVLFCSTNSCGGTQLSTEWRISEKYGFVSNGSYLIINSSWNDEHVSCCLHRQNMQCQNGNLLDFCAETIIFFAEDKHAPDSKNTENCMNLKPAVIVLTITTIFLSIVVFCFSDRNKIRRLYAVRHMDEFWELVCIKKCKDRAKMEGAMQYEVANIELEPNMEPEARHFMGGAKQCKDTDTEQKPSMELEDIFGMGGAKQCKDTDTEQKPSMELEDIFDNYNSWIARAVLHRSEAFKQEPEGHSMVEVLHTSEAFEQEPEDHSMVEDTSLSDDLRSSADSEASLIPGRHYR